MESAEKLSRLQVEWIEREGWNPKYREDYLFEPKYSPAHGLRLSCLKAIEKTHMRRTVKTSTSEADYEKEFNSVWQQFVSEPLDDVMPVVGPGICDRIW